MGVADDGVGGVDLPAAIFFRAEQRGEAGVGIEARRAEPVDRAIKPDERACVRIADKSVIL